MRIVGGLDVHRAQITYDYLDLRTGEEVRGQIRPATRAEVRAFLATFGRKTAAFALEGTTGWRFIVEELRRAGMEAHLAEPAETRARRGPKRRAKTDRADSPSASRSPACGQPTRVLDPTGPPRRSPHDRSAPQGTHRRERHVAAPYARPALPSRAPGPTRSSEQSRAGVSGEDNAPTRGAPGSRHRLAFCSTAWTNSSKRSMPSSSRSRDVSTAVRCSVASGASAQCSRQRSLPSSGTRDASRAHASRSVLPGSTSPSRSPTASVQEVTSPARAHRHCAGHFTKRLAGRGGWPRPTTTITSRQSGASA